MNQKHKIIEWLFQTDAVKISPEDQPFWYTSGTLGPYYINTHFLYGSRSKAEALLAEIDVHKSDRLGCPDRIMSLTWENYEQDPIFHGLIDAMVERAKESLPIADIEYISGGERRDWFFSYPIARLLGKPHITLYKDMAAVVTDMHGTRRIEDLKGATVLHIADLVTEASSYERAWIPAIKQWGGNMRWTLVVIDRKQGGKELLERMGVDMLAMAAVDETLFDQALEMKYITQGQYEMLQGYLTHPKETMRRFLLEHPDFLQAALAGDARTAERARLCVQTNIYDLL